MLCWQHKLTFSGGPHESIVSRFILVIDSFDADGL